jgi:Bacterial alpha-L-rhamnosidase C-terminal domain
VRRATVWRARAQQLAGRFASAFWDPSVGAFQDTTEDDAVHPQDGNAFAILAGLASPEQARSALEYLDRTTAGSNGNAIADTDGWRGPNWGADDNERIYPFIGYFDVLARYAAGADDSALDLLRREWGSMATRQPGTMWEMVDYETEGRDTVAPSVDHGWSSGAAAAITSYVLGVQPTAPGFSTFTVAPHPGDLSWAQGSVPTPQGPIRVSWRKAAGGLALSVTAPRGTRWVRPAAGRR